MPPLNVLSLFSGCGGADWGFKAAGFEILGGIDIDKRCQTTYERNIGVPLDIMDVRDLQIDWVKNTLDEPPTWHWRLWNQQTRQTLVRVKHLDGIIWSAPCIHASKAKGKNRNMEEEMILIREGMRVVSAVGPRFWLMENIPDIRPSFEREFPNAHLRIYDTVDFGLAQNRPRLFASNLPLPQFPKRAPVAVKDVIDPETPDLTVPNATDKLNFDMAKTLAKIGRGFGMQKRRILAPPRPSPAVTDMHGDSFLVPRHDGSYYLCSVRDHARLQGFPDDFEFQGSVSHNFKMVGNAVSPVIARTLAAHILQQITMEVT